MPEVRMPSPVGICSLSVTVAATEPITGNVIITPGMTVLGATAPLMGAPPLTTRFVATRLPLLEAVMPLQELFAVATSVSPVMRALSTFKPSTVELLIASDPPGVTTPLVVFVMVPVDNTGNPITPAVALSTVSVNGPPPPMGSVTGATGGKVTVISGSIGGS